MGVFNSGVVGKGNDFENIRPHIIFENIRPHPNPPAQKDDAEARFILSSDRRAVFWATLKAMESESGTKSTSILAQE